jgi:4-hydroxybenzoate polyprenyltransferase
MTALAADRSMLDSLRAAAADIKIAHSMFAMPFAVLASFMAAAGDGPIEWTRFAMQLVLVVFAMILARTAAMLANRLIDREIDARNPRTRGRAIPAGRLSPRRAAAFITVAGAGFMLVCLMFGALDDNWWPSILGLPVLAWISAYGFLKRHTALCHLYLGTSLAISPLAAALAVHPQSLAHQPVLWLLAAMVMCWVAGFDVIYALQDVDVDRSEGLHSVPARFGRRGALWVSRGLHGAAAACLIVALVVDTRFEFLFAIGVLAVSVLLAVEHATVARWGTKRLAMTVFTLNGVIACVLGGLGVADVLL